MISGIIKYTVSFHIGKVPCGTMSANRTVRFHTVTNRYDSMHWKQTNRYTHHSSHLSGGDAPERPCPCTLQQNQLASMQDASPVIQLGYLYTKRTSWS